MSYIPHYKKINGFQIIIWAKGNLHFIASQVYIIFLYSLVNLCTRLSDWFQLHNNTFFYISSHFLYFLTNINHDFFRFFFDRTCCFMWTTPCMLLSARAHILFRTLLNSNWSLREDFFLRVWRHFVEFCSAVNFFTCPFIFLCGQIIIVSIFSAITHEVNFTGHLSWKAY